MSYGRSVARTYVVVALIASLSLTACGGGGGGGASATGVVPAPQPTSTAQAPTGQAVKVIATVDLPTQTTSSDKRRPYFVSPSTNGATLVAKDHTSGTTILSVTYDFSSGSGLCTTSSPRSCTMSFSIVPGNYDWTLALYDQAPSGGSIPGTAKALGISQITQAISANSSNTLNFSVSGYVTGAPGVTCSPTACGALSYYSLPADGSSHTFTFGLTWYDPDGNAMTGSVPFTSSQTATLTEIGGAGHSYLTLNGTNVGTSATITKATDTLALVYDGKGSSGYSTSTNIAGTSVTLSPLYLGASGPAPSLSITKLSQTVTDGITEKSAPAGIAYSSAISGACSEITADTASGSGASATESITTSTAPGTSTSCTVNVKDTDQTTTPVTINFSVSGPITAGTPTFGGGGGSGTCSSLAFTGASQTATMTMSDPLYTGGALTVSSSNTSVATVSETGSGATQSSTITAVAAGTATISYSDTTGNTLSCSVGVTTSGGTVQ